MPHVLLHLDTGRGECLCLSSWCEGDSTWMARCARLTRCDLMQAVAPVVTRFCDLYLESKLEVGGRRHVVVALVRRRCVGPWL